MPVFRLPAEHVFPPPDLAESNGLLAVGGDLSEARLLLAYSMGIFPWYSQHDPILWWSPDPRLVLFPDKLKVSRSLKQTMKKKIFTVTLDRAFDKVISSCARAHGDTWITGDMMEAYIRLHDAGYAHSVEVWCDKQLAGGLYGVSLGSAFFGESMFTKKSNASKVALVTLAQQLVKWDFSFMDCQLTTPHLIGLGGQEIPRSEFLTLLESALLKPAKKGKWTLGVFPGIHKRALTQDS